MMSSQQIFPILVLTFVSMATVTLARAPTWLRLPLTSYDSQGDNEARLDNYGDYASSDMVAKRSNLKEYVDALARLQNEAQLQSEPIKMPRRKSAVFTTLRGKRHCWNMFDMCCTARIGCKK